MGALRESVQQYTGARFLQDPHQGGFTNAPCRLEASGIAIARVRAYPHSSLEPFADFLCIYACMHLDLLCSSFAPPDTHHSDPTCHSAHPTAGIHSLGPLPSGSSPGCLSPCRRSREARTNTSRQASSHALPPQVCCLSRGA